MNHSTASTKEVYAAAIETVRTTTATAITGQRIELSEIDIVPFYW
jgi:hypothetical protein